MNSKNYIKNALRTESKVSQVTVNDRGTFEAVVKAFTASAKLLDLYKKNIYYGKPVDVNKFSDAAVDLSAAQRTLQHALSTTSLVTTSTDVLHIDSRLLHAILGLATESGELMETVQANLETQTPLDHVNLQEEVGDLNWYQAILIDALGADWDEIRERNIAKLRARYPDKFDSDKAINRNLKAERKILEGDKSPPGDARSKGDYYSIGGSDF